jgi:predicted TIM-barrel fold metal-dependent hydrolase
MRVHWAITAALAASGATAARVPAQAPFPVGTYVRTITAADRPPIPPLVGVWRIRFDTAGRVDVRKDGQLAVTGRYTLAGDTITLTDDGGPMAGRGAEATGRYRWTRTAAGLGLHVVADREAGRRFIFGQGPLQPLAAPAPRDVAADSAMGARTGARTGAFGPIIDVHLHGARAGPLGPTRPNPVSGRPVAARTGEELRRLTLAAMAEHGVVLGVVSVPGGPVSENGLWAAESGGRLLPGASGFSDFPRLPFPTVDELRRAHQAGALALIGEVGAQYSGLALDDPRLEPYYALAEELDIPIGVHTGAGAPGTALRGARTFRMALGRPLALEDVLVRHPKLRVFLMHAGWPYREETIGLMTHYPQVYADLSAISWAAPPAEFHDYLQALTRIGLGDRLMFGSDGGDWVDAIGMAIDGVASAPFLSAAQKRAIFFDNAVRFFRLDSARVRTLTTGAAGR